MGDRSASLARTRHRDVARKTIALTHGSSGVFRSRRASAAVSARMSVSSMRSAGSMWARRDSAAAAGSSRRIGAGLLRRGQTSFGMLECMRRNRRVRPVLPPRSAFAGFRFPREVIVLAVRWYLRYGLSYRDVEELLAERGVHVNHVSIHRLVRRFTPILAEAARCARHGIGTRWQVDETYVKVAGCWRYVYRAVDEDGQVIDVYVSPRRASGAARRFFHRALATAVVAPVEVATDQAACYLRVLEEVLPKTWHCIERYATNRIEADHAQLKQRLRPMRGLKTDVGARTVIAGHAFIQNIRRGHYELAADAPPILRVAAAFDELAQAV
jgi:transposase-like protein